MMPLIQLAARRITRPIERWWRSRQDAAHADEGPAAKLRVSDVNRGLVPLALFLIFAAVVAGGLAAIFLIESKPDDPDHWTDWWALPIVVIGMIIFAVMAIRRAIWIDIASDEVVVRRLASRKSYTPNALRYWAFELEPELWGPLPPLAEVASEVRFKLCLVDGFTFDATVTAGKAQRIRSALQRLIGVVAMDRDSQLAGYVHNPLRLTELAAGVARHLGRKQGLSSAVLLAKTAPAPEQPDQIVYALELLATAPKGTIVTESHGLPVAVLPHEAPLFVGLMIDFQRGAGFQFGA